MRKAARHSPSSGSNMYNTNWCHPVTILRSMKSAFFRNDFSAVVFVSTSIARVCANRFWSLWCRQIFGHGRRDSDNIPILRIVSSENYMIIIDRFATPRGRFNYNNEVYTFMVLIKNSWLWANPRFDENFNHVIMVYSIT